MSFFEQLRNFPSCPPRTIAAVIAGAYLVFVSLYIWISGKIAAQIATNKQHLQTIELFKGLLFVFITGAFLFFLLFWTFRQLKNISNADEVEQTSSFHPLGISTVIAGSYLVFISLYIWISGKIAAQIATNKKNLEHIELIKGLLFVFITASLLFFLLFWVFRKLKQREDIILSQNKSILASEKLTIAGLFSLSICHDINNILIVLVGNTEILQESDHLDSLEQQMLQEIMQASETLMQLTQRMMKAGRDSIPGQIEPVDLVQVIQDTLHFAKRHRKLKGCHIEAFLPQTLPFSANAALFSRALINLLINAADATQEKGTIHVKLFSKPDALTLEVHDNGPGIPPSQTEKILEPFFTTKADGNGLGLLSFKLCAQQHQGAIQIHVSPLGGACFSLEIPFLSTNQVTHTPPSLQTLHSQTTQAPQTLRSTSPTIRTLANSKQSKDD